MKMSDKAEINKVHEKAQAEDAHLFNHTLKGDKVGLRHHGGAATGNTVDIERKKKKERKQFHALMKMLNDWQDNMAGLEGRLGDVLDKADDSLSRIVQMQKLKENWNMQDTQIFFLNEYGQDISVMDEQAAKQLLDDTLDQETMDFVRYMEEAMSIDGQMQDKLNDPAFLNATPEQQAQIREECMGEGLKRMSDLNARAEAVLGISSDRLIDQLCTKTNDSSELFAQTNTEANAEEYSIISNTTFDNDPFATVASQSSTSFSAIIQDDPFAEMAGTITDSFNSAVEGAKPDIDNKNELKNTNDIQVTVPQKNGL